MYKTSQLFCIFHDLLRFDICRIYRCRCICHKNRCLSILAMTYQMKWLWLRTDNYQGLVCRIMKCRGFLNFNDYIVSQSSPCSVSDIYFGQLQQWRAWVGTGPRFNINGIFYALYWTRLGAPSGMVLTKTETPVLVKTYTLFPTNSPVYPKGDTFQPVDRRTAWSVRLLMYLDCPARNAKRVSLSTSSRNVKVFHSYTIPSLSCVIATNHMMTSSNGDIFR